MRSIGFVPTTSRRTRTEGGQLFQPGQVCLTPGVTRLLQGQGPTMILHLTQVLRRHLSGDWGEVCAEDAALNEASVKAGDRVLSAYTLGGEKVWIITEADRSVTTVLLPSEY